MYRAFRLSQIAFLGAGKLVEALTKGFVSAGTIQLHEIWSSAPTERDIKWLQKLGCKTTTDNVKLAKENNLIILAVKPQILVHVLREIAPHLSADHLILSFAAGIKIQTMEMLLPPRTRIVRLMTNTPVQYREGVSAFTLGTNCLPEDRKFVNQLMNSVGYCTELEESLLDTVTGAAGGGPAYAYTFIDAIADGAVHGGMNRAEALIMAAKTVLGAAKMILETEKHPGELKDAVCSGGGSTIHGIYSLESGGMRGAVIDAVKAATERSRKLGESLNGTKKT
ncbi:pyrroline-5-carboxylate reductase 1, mitochondrial [Hydra vulgaris]|uniref:Pyrroline-5-carboxylate reductase n=1 Tax=Hydra vulgaris TaxID=6087 RepID=A0ABM4D3S1_HYDVU